METNRKRSLLTAAIVSLVALNAISLGFLWVGRHHEGPRWHRSEGPESFDRILALDEGQKKQFDALRKAHFTATGLILSNIHETRLALVNAMITNPENPSLLSELSSRIGNDQARLDRLFVDHFAQLRKICRDDQRARLDSHLREMIRSPHGPMGRRPPLTRDENGPKGPSRE